MRQMGGAVRTLMTEFNKDAPDAATVKTAAAKLDTLANQLPGWFATPTTGAPTAAKPEIWTDAAGFAAAAKALQAQTGKLAQLADGPDFAAAKAQAMTIPGGPCKACHDSYRATEKK
jgi:cytochrome c556